jgi:ribosomal-protein-alanine N-acetyltransferase
MSVSALSPAENKIPASTEYPSLELVRFAPVWQEGLKQFLQELKDSGDEIFFAPHSTDDLSIAKIACHNGKDLYYLIVEDKKVLGYGLLRGWDDGYVIPSLGIAIHPSARGAGLGKFFMDFLHMQAFRRGASKVRLRVNKKNERAIALYKSFDYLFEEDAKQVEYLVGFKNLGNE